MAEHEMLGEAQPFGPTVGRPQAPVLTRDAATDAFWAGRWAGMASELARALCNATGGADPLGVYAEFERLREQFESPAYFVAPSGVATWRDLEDGIR